MNGKHTPSQQGNKGQSNKNNEGKSFAELAKEALDFFGNLYGEILHFKKSPKIDELFQKTEEFVQKYGKDVTTHQLRNIFHEIKKVNDIMQLKLLRPNLAYIAGRLDEKNKEGRIFVALIDSLIKEAKSEDIDNFKDFMEAIVAYHKFYGKTN
ncbi:MAG: type III-A CRISPR-associated protein Csm2 [Cytophagales bacterium]|nr:type III-A CRISPR-associated protein Csm2 [Raineya sp.]MDW8211511.1 type III-A CRISPR-associated protein Csm2 [Cytophagales bacterium]